MSRKNDYKTTTMQSVPTNLPLWVKGAIEAYIALRKRDIPILASLLQIWESPTGTDAERKAFLEIYYQCLPCDAQVQSQQKIMYPADELDQMIATRQSSRGAWKSLSLPPRPRSRERAAS